MVSTQYGCVRTTYSYYRNPEYPSSIYVIGGFCNQSLPSIERYDLDTQCWNTVDTLLETPRTKFGAFEHNDWIYIIGGKNADGQRISTSEILTITGQKLTKNQTDFKPALSTCKSGFGTIKLDSTVYIIGGNDGKVTDTVCCIHLPSSTTTQCPSMHSTRDELAVITNNIDTVYAIGGYGSGKKICLSACEKYNINSKKWSCMPHMNIPRRALAAAYYDERVYVVGGYDGTEYLGSVEVYNNGTWTLLSPMTYPRCTHTATLVTLPSPDNNTTKTYIYVTGGFNSQPLNKVERYDIQNDTWEVIQPMQNSRFMHSTIAY